MPTKFEAARTEVLAKLNAGCAIDHKQAGEIAEGSSRTWAHEFLSGLHKKGVIRILRWQRAKNGGMPMPVYVLGPGDDAERPTPFTNSDKCRRRRMKKTTVIDPIHAALLGYKRRGGPNGWFKEVA